MRETVKYDDMFKTTLADTITDIDTRAGTEMTTEP